MKIIGTILLVLGLLIGFFQIKGGILTNYHYEKEIASNWELADKASTLSQKKVYLEKFILALEKSTHSDYNAFWLKTDNNSFSKNMEALKSLVSRLKKLETMDEQSFAYQTAIQQITAQEQGEAKEMLSVFIGCYYLENSFINWEWFAVLIGILCGLLIIIGLIFFLPEGFFD